MKTTKLTQKDLRSPDPFQQMVMTAISRSDSSAEEVSQHANWKDSDDPFMEVSPIYVNGVECSAADWAKWLYSTFESSVEREVNDRLENFASTQMSNAREKLDQLESNLDDLVREIKPSWQQDYEDRS